MKGRSVDVLTEALDLVSCLEVHIPYYQDQPNHWYKNMQVCLPGDKGSIQGWNITNYLHEEF